MIRHIVLTKFKPETSEDKIAEIYSGLAGVAKRLEGAQDFRGGRSESPEQIERGYLHGFTIDFDVNGQVDKQIAELFKDESTANSFNYFLAAEYYFHNDRDLKKAEGWIKTGLEKSPKNPRFGLLHAKIVNKQGRKADALKIIAEANGWARESNNANYTEQTQLFWDSIK